MNLLLSFFLLLSSPITHAPAAEPLLVATESAGEYGIVASASAMEARFVYLFAEANPGAYSITQDGEQYYLHAKEEGSAPNQIYRLALDQQGNKLMLPLSMVGETCAGAPCSNCAFASGGGCECLETGTCNHTITRDTFKE